MQLSDLAGRSGDDLGGLLRILGGQVGHLDFHDLHQLVLRDLADFLLVRLSGSRGETRDLLQQDRCGRLLRDEGERRIGEHRDLDGQQVTGLGLRPRVEVLAELHDVHAGLTEGGADRGRGVRLAGDDLEFENGFNFFCHDWGVWVLQEG